MNPTIPTGCFPREVIASMLNVPVDTVRVGAVLFPFWYGGRGVEIRACEDGR